MPLESALHDVLRNLALTLTGPYEVAEVLDQLSDGVVAVLGADGAGVSIGDPGGALRSVSAANDLSAHVERCQETLQEGPCRDAFTSGERAASGDLTNEERWPALRPRALDAGVHAIAGLAMNVDSRPIGALDVYSLQPRNWSPQDLHAAQLLAEVASAYVANAQELERRRSLAGHLQQALDSRVVIEQAKGVLAERHGVDVHVAFQRLRRHVRRNGLKLHVAAGDVVAGTLDIPAEP